MGAAASNGLEILQQGIGTKPTGNGFNWEHVYCVLQSVSSEFRLHI